MTRKCEQLDEEVEHWRLIGKDADLKMDEFRKQLEQSEQKEVDLESQLSVPNIDANLRRPQGKLLTL